MMKTRNNYRIRKASSTVFFELILIVLGFFFLMPFIFMLRTAFMSARQAAKVPLQWIPDPFTVENIISGIQKVPFWTFLKNSVVLTSLCIVGTVVSSSLVAFGFARLKAPGKKFFFALLLSTMMIPGTVTLIPTFAMYSKLGWIDTLLPLVLPCFFGGGAFYIFLLRQFFASIPGELAESAMIDGSGWIRIFFQIYLPNAKPALLVVTIMTFVNIWNDYFGPMIYLTNPKNYTLALGMTMFKNQYGGALNMGPMMAVAFLAVLPLLITYIVFQKYFVQGVVTSGIKG